MRVAEIQKLANKAQVITQKESLSLDSFFNYLNTLVTRFEATKQNILGDITIDFQKHLKTVSNVLGVTNSQLKGNIVDQHLVENLNLVDFAAFLDIVIRTASINNPSSTELKNLAVRNIFRTHINKQILSKLQSMFHEDHFHPKDMKYIDSLSSSLIGLETKKLHETMPDSKREHFYIFDIDGTLKQEELNCLTHAVPNIDNQVRKDLIRLSQRPNTKVRMLTSRSTDEIKESNIPHEVIPVITGSGREVINGDRHKILISHELIEETQKFAGHLHTLLKNLGITEDQYLIRQYAGSIYIQFKENSFTKAKLQAMKALRVLVDPSSSWSLDDIGSRYFFLSNSKIKNDKGIALKKLLEDHKDSINSKTNIYVLGDTGSDYKAMEALQEIKLPKGARKINIAVGKQLADKKKYPAVDERLTSHHSMADLLNWLAI